MAPQNSLPIHGNERTMNMNSLILTNIQSSPYFKVNLYELKTYHEVIDEIYYRVSHLEPWEKGSRKTAGQTGMCGGVRGVGAGGIVSSAYCLLYKLFTLRLTRKQVIGLCSHSDSPYIRGLGFMYIRYTQPPADLWDWYVDYLDDDEEVDVKAGGGHIMTIGEMLRQWLQKLEWYSTLFPRIPVPVQKTIAANMKEKLMSENQAEASHHREAEEPRHREADSRRPHGDEGADVGFGEAERHSRMGGSGTLRAGPSRPSPPFDIAKEIEREKDRHRDRSKERHRSRDRDRDRHRSPLRHRSRSRDRKRSRSKDRDRKRSSPERDHHRDRDRDRRRSRSRDRQRRSKSRDRKRSRSRDRDRDRKGSHSHSSRDKRRSRSRSRDRKRDDHKHKKSHRSRSRERGKDRSDRGGSRDGNRHRESSFERDLRKEKDRIHRSENGD